MKRDWARVLAVGGSLVVIQSVFWEYARMRPDYRFLVEPWAIRGFDSIHGVVFATIGVGLLAAVLPVAARLSTTSRNSVLIVAGMVVAAFIITLIFARDEDVSLSGDSIGAIVFGVGLGLTLHLAVVRLAESGRLGEAPRRTLAGATGGLIMLAVVIFVVLLMRVVLGTETTMGTPFAVLLLMTVIGVAMALLRPHSMASHRMLMAATVIGGTVIGLSAAAIRSTLVRIQAETGPLFASGQYRDTQVTWGYFLANIGVVLTFAGAVMMWARRRDIVQSQQRAARQRQAAEESAQELAAAR